MGIIFIFSKNLGQANDFQTFFDIGHLARQGYPTSSPSPTTGMYVFYLPAFAYLFSIFSYFPIQFIWFFWNFLKLGFISFFVAKSSEKWLLLICTLIGLGYLDADFKLGQFNLLVFFFLYFSYYFISKQKFWPAALFLNLACLKVVPILFLPYFFYQYRKKIIFPFLILFLSLNALGMLIYKSFSIPIQNFKDLVSVSLVQKINNADAAFFQNQSLIGLLSRQIPSDPNLQKFLWLLLASIVLITGFYALIKIKKINDLFFSMLLLAMLLLSPDTRGPHLVALIYPIYLISSHLDKKTRLFFLSGHFIFAILTSPDVVGSEIYERLLSNSLILILLTIDYFITLQLIKPKSSPTYA